MGCTVQAENELSCFDFAAALKYIHKSQQGCIISWVSPHAQ